MAVAWLAEQRRGETWPTRHSVSFVLPAYNEEANITRAIESTVFVAERHCAEFEIIVVDDGSVDRTAELVTACADRHHQVRLIQHGVNRGYGEALRSGFDDAKLDFVFFTDSDNQFDMEELELLLAWADEADVVAGYRKIRRDPAMRRLNAWAWNRLVRALFYVPVRDIDCAFKLFRRQALADIAIESRGAMINTEIMVKLARRGATVVEVGVTHMPRIAGSTTGAKPSVIFRAFREVQAMYPRLSQLDRGAGPGLPHLAGHEASA
jgi:glycosyltransferase involved in cell wall biosynthesis